METPKPRNAAVILAGAVVKGAFEAGALQVIADREIPVSRIVAASAGALNGTAYAAGVRARREKAAAAEMVAFWCEHGGFFNAFALSLGDVFRGVGASDQRHLLEHLRGTVQPSSVDNPAPIDLRIVVAALNGVIGDIGGEPATTYEQILAFQGEHFDSAAKLEEVFNATVASAAFPGMFAPVEVPNGVGPCYDGGVVNNAPIHSALDQGKDTSIDTILVIVPTAAVFPRPAGELTGLSLVSHLAEVLINERLYRDLHQAEATNTSLLKLEELVRRRGWAPEALPEIKAAMDLGDKRFIKIVQIRPLVPLPGNGFDGFFDASMRRNYVEVGIARARAVFDEQGWQ